MQPKRVTVKQEKMTTGRLLGRCRRSRLFQSAGALAAGSLILAACGSSPSPSSAPKPSTTSSAYFDMEPCCAWGSTWSFNPFNAYFWDPGEYFTVLPLADRIPPKIATFQPQLASSWSVSGDKLTVTLRSGVKWQNGSPVTSTDVVDTMLLDGTNGTGPWDGVSDISAPSASTVVFTIRKGIPAALAERDVLPILIYPSSVYGRFVTPNLKSEVISYYNTLLSNPAAASKTAASKAIGSVFANLSKYSPKSLVGDGPFKEVAVSVSSAKLVKWSGYYGASKIHVAGIYWADGLTNQAIYPELYGGDVDLSNVYMPPTIIKKWLKTPNAHIALVPSFEFAIGWPDYKYPLNNVKVRQALAYVIPRKKMTAITYGTVDPGGIAESTPDGLEPGVQSLYLSKSQISQLNTYSLNLTKAADLLTSAGFHKSGGQWIMPDGKPFTLTAGVNSATSDVISDFEIMATSLTNFGIKTTVTEVPGASTEADFEKGVFDLNWIGTGNLDPLTEIATYLGTADGNNFPSLGTYSGDKGLGFGPVEDVPGIGTVNIPNTIQEEADSVGTGPKMDKLVFDWASYVNKELPFLQWQNKGYQFEYSTAKFTNWPSASNPVWQAVGYNLYEGFALIFEDGYISPR
jgi:peptide/nickel transport system substrate-binding protein